MNLQMLEQAAMIVFEMCRQHPEICPHNYQWYLTNTDNKDGKRVKHYKCSLCGREYERYEDIKD